MQSMQMVHPCLDRVRTHTAPGVNESIDRKIAEKVEYFSERPKEEISRRLIHIEREWDIERVLEANASTLVLTGALLSVFRDRRWIALPMVVGSFLLMHAAQGWCPPVPILRRLGVRTQPEIDAEKFALKALRGDFDTMDRNNPQSILAAVADRVSA